MTNRHPWIVLLLVATLALPLHLRAQDLGFDDLSYSQASPPSDAWNVAGAIASVAPSQRLVLVISIDGLRPDAWREAETPNLDRLAEEGSYTECARAVEKPKTLPGHASMVTGVPPSVHGFEFNRDHPLRHEIKQSTVFRWVRAAGLDTALIVSKNKLKLLGPHGDALKCRKAKGSHGVVKKAIKYIEGGRRGLFFLHLLEVDARGHKKGWMSEDQIETVELVDKEIGLLREQVVDNGLLDVTTWIVLADHGGHEDNHWLDIPEDMTVPFIMSGLGVKRGGHLGDNVTIMDVAPTAAAFLGVAPPTGLHGKALAEGMTFAPPEPDAAVNEIPGKKRSLFGKVRRAIGRLNPLQYR